jgi:predicted glycoside hydrolase/deacetylase ChbG (UPF0249 family)
MATRYLIVNADDFGMTTGVTRGILEAHTRGIVTSTSLMVDAAGAEEAARLARSTPGLGLGLHVDLSAGNANGGFGEYAGDPSTRLERELTRQVERFIELVGRPPGHMDSHRDVHRDPHRLPAFLEAARRWGAPLRGFSAVRRLSRFYGQWGGESHPEQIGVESLARMLESDVGDGVTELICHPGYADAQLDSSYAREREVEVATLCDPRIRCALATLGIELTTHEARAWQVPNPR